MRQIELNVYNKLKKDFPSEIEVFEKATDALVIYSESLKDQSPYYPTSNIISELLNTSVEKRCVTTQIILISHSVANIKAARLLLLTGYVGSAMSCLRTSFESFQDAHICSISDTEATKFLTGSKINKKVTSLSPVQLEEYTTTEIKKILSNIGVHPSYKSLENQGLFEGTVFHEEYRVTYEFLFLRSIWSCFSIQLYMLTYLAKKWPDILNKIPSGIQVLSNLNNMLQRTAEGVEKRART